MGDDRSHDLSSCCLPGTAPDSTEPPSILSIAGCKTGICAPTFHSNKGRLRETLLSLLKVLWPVSEGSRT